MKALVDSYFSDNAESEIGRQFRKLWHDTFEPELKILHTQFADRSEYGIVHCYDEWEKLDNLVDRSSYYTGFSINGTFIKIEVDYRCAEYHETEYFELPRDLLQESFQETVLKARLFIAKYCEELRQKFQKAYEVREHENKLQRYQTYLSLKEEFDNQPPYL